MTKTRRREIVVLSNSLYRKQSLLQEAHEELEGSDDTLISTELRDRINRELQR